MPYIDSHAHLTSSAVLPNIEGILVRARQAGVSHILNICTDPVTLGEGILLASKYPFIKNAGATTPHDVAQEGDTAFPIFSAAAKEKKLAAIGETGLDYHYLHSPKEIQQKFLKRYLFLAAESHLPVIFHCRDAFADLFSISDIEYPKKSPAVLHCFTGTVGEAEQVIKRGWHISLSGIVTFKKSESLREVAKIVPLSQLLIETDTPYLAPQGQRGKSNEPSYILEVAACIAEAKGISIEEVAAATSDNAKRLFLFE
jgi:TatD DNase family protein